MGKRKFDFDFDLMGKKVVVTKIYERKYDKDIVSYVSLDVEERRQGWVVGYRWLNEGERIPASSGGGSYYAYGWDSEPEYEPASFEITRKIPTLLVTYWPNQKPIYVPLNGYIFIPDEVYFEPLYSSSGYGSGPRRNEWLQDYRNLCANEPELFPRDSKGRFCKLKKLGMI